MNQLNLIVDTIRENHFIPRNAEFFDQLCNHFAIHYGFNNVESAWATKIGDTHPDIRKYMLKGKPDWLPNALIVDLGRSHGLYCANRLPLTRKNRVLRVLYSADEHRHHFTSKRNAGEAYIRYASMFDCVFLRQKSVMKFYDDKKTYWFPHCAQEEMIPKDVIEPTHDLVFISASMTKERQQMIKQLKEFNLLFIEGGLSEAEYYRSIGLGRISINKTQTEDEVNKRVFEVMASGSMLLTNKTINTGLDELFENQKHLVMYNNDKEMLDLIHYYLTHEKERAQIAANGRTEVLLKHTSKKRVEQIVNFLLEHI